MGWKVAKAGGINLAMSWIRDSLKEQLMGGLKSVGEGITGGIKGFFGKLNPFGKKKDEKD